MLTSSYMIFLGGGFKYFLLLAPLWGMIQFDYIVFSKWVCISTISQKAGLCNEKPKMLTRSQTSLYTASTLFAYFEGGNSDSKASLKLNEFSFSLPTKTLLRILTINIC